MDLFERVSEDIKTAMKAKDKVALETLRNIKKVFLEAKTAPGANDTLTDDAALKIMQKLMKQGKDAAEIYIQQGRQDLADEELAQVKVIEIYLPKQMSAEELEAALKEIIAETGATSGKDMGKVMGVASKKLAGLAEGRAISAKVKRIAGIISCFVPVIARVFGRQKKTNQLLSPKNTASFCILLSIIIFNSNTIVIFATHFKGISPHNNKTRILAQYHEKQYKDMEINSPCGDNVFLV